MNFGISLGNREISFDDTILTLKRRCFNLGNFMIYHTNLLFGKRNGKKENPEISCEEMVILKEI